MKKKETARVIPFAGELSYDLTGQEPALEIFKVLWESATEFAMINLVPVITEDSGKEKRRSFQHAFACFPALQPAMTQAMWASEWPGTATISPPFRLLISGKTRKLDFDRMFDEHSSVFWTKYGGWEDLMLFSKGALMFYVCSHERFGSIFGDEALFQRIGLKGAQGKAEKLHDLRRGNEHERAPNERFAGYGKWLSDATLADNHAESFSGHHGLMEITRELPIHQKHNLLENS